ncbi:riboflavin synthase [Clostridium sp. SHJSY1]|uniref:riboflavin synthase n=1 Tax=Clostridium sp. SHJSY1 TaxID=2942483 RepID=UPI00287414BC|nr:riboflavin synthase [Clostridium sp. SHJSY1]MDS0526936.1 riboflavin synthase [Clostridium sp. SHJSY1]
MFTGIVEELGEIKSIKNGEKSSVLVIKANKVLQNTRLGDSICTNGVCLTVTNINGDAFEADVMAETLRRSNLGELRKSSKVNLERALSLQDRLGGHLVSGHIDGIGEIISIQKEDNATWFQIKLEESLLRYVVEKGSIAIDGISLTVAYVDDKSFKVSIIPHTAKETVLLMKGIGEKVNIECDIVGKYIEKLFINKEEKKKTSIDEGFLRINGFM